MFQGKKDTLENPLFFGTDYNHSSVDSQLELTKINT